MKRISVLFSAAVALAAALEVGIGGTQDGRTLLNELRQELRSARSLPTGTRITLPDKNVSSLVGLRSADIQHFLGWPSYCGHDETWSEKGSDCGGKTPWKYVWGPPSPAPTSAGPGRVVVVAGGPPVLVLDFSAGTVTAARCEEQR